MILHREFLWEFLYDAFDIMDDILLDRVFKRFDADKDGYINQEEWILGLSIFLRGTNTERVQARIISYLYRKQLFYECL